MAFDLFSPTASRLSAFHAASLMALLAISSKRPSLASRSLLPSYQGVGGTRSGGDVNSGVATYFERSNREFVDGGGQVWTSVEEKAALKSPMQSQQTIVAVPSFTLLYPDHLCQVRHVSVTPLATVRTAEAPTHVR